MERLRFGGGGAIGPYWGGASFSVGGGGAIAPLDPPPRTATTHRL